eukprot:4077692-Pleurochrysis_carterae.AAC.3
MHEDPDALCCCFWSLVKCFKRVLSSALSDSPLRLHASALPADGAAAGDRLLGDQALVPSGSAQIPAQVRGGAPRTFVTAGADAIEKPTCGIDLHVPFHLL